MNKQNRFGVVAALRVIAREVMADLTKDPRIRHPLQNTKTQVIMVRQDVED